MGVDAVEDFYDLFHLIRLERPGVEVGGHLRHAGKRAVSPDPLALHRLAHVDVGMRQVGQRPVQVRRVGLLNELLQPLRHQAADGDADQRFDERGAVADVAAQGEADLQRMGRLVGTAFRQFKANAQGEQRGDGAHFLYVRQQRGDALLAKFLGNAPVAFLAAGAGVHFLKGRLALLEELV